MLKTVQMRTLWKEKYQPDSMTIDRTFDTPKIGPATYTIPLKKLSA